MEESGRFSTESKNVKYRISNVTIILSTHRLFFLDIDGFAFVDGLEPTEDCTRKVLEKIGYMKNTVFGDFWSFEVNTEKKKESLVHADTAYTGLPIEVREMLFSVASGYRFF